MHNPHRALLLSRIADGVRGGSEPVEASNDELADFSQALQISPLVPMPTVDTPSEALSRDGRGRSARDRRVRDRPRLSSHPERDLSPKEDTS